MGAAIALRRFVPVQIIGSRMRIVFILLAAVVFEAAISAVTEFDEFVPSESVSVPVNHGSEEELDQVVAPSRIKGLPNWLDQWAHGKDTKKTKLAETKTKNATKKKKKPVAKLAKPSAKKNVKKATMGVSEKKAKCEKAKKKAAEKKAKAAVKVKKKKKPTKKPLQHKGAWYERAQKIMEKMAKLNAAKHKRHLERIAKRKARERARKERMKKFIAKMKHKT